MANRLSTMQLGQRFGPYDVTLSTPATAAYSTAVGGPESPTYGGAVPPLAIVASALGKLIADLGIGTGTVHAGQEVDFLRPVLPGETVSATGELKGNSVRREARFATIATEFRDASGKLVATASSTVIVPA